MSAMFKDKVALVTGASSGIGRATALAFAREGAKVIVVARRKIEGEETVRLITDLDGIAHYFQADVSEPDQVKLMVQAAAERYGRLDYACNNAGTSALRGLTAEVTEEEWESVIRTNLTGVWLCMKYEIPEMLKVGGGAIVNVSSTYGLVARKRAAAYVASKHGLNGLTKAAALDYATLNIRINAVCPAAILTPLLEEIAGSPEKMEFYASAHPMKRIGTAEEVAEAVMWLCSDKSSFTTGQLLGVDGGFLA